MAIDKELDDLIVHELSSGNYKVKMVDGPLYYKYRITIPQNGWFGRRITITSCYNGCSVENIQVYKNMFSSLIFRNPVGNCCSVAHEVFRENLNKKEQKLINEQKLFISNWVDTFKKSGKSSS